MQLPSSLTPAATNSGPVVKLEQAEAYLPPIPLQTSPQLPSELPTFSHSHSPTPPQKSPQADQGGSIRHPWQQSLDAETVPSCAPPTFTISAQAALANIPLARPHRQTSRASSVRPVAASALQQREHSRRPDTTSAPLARVPICWGQQRPRTRRQGQPEVSTTDLATVAAAAAAEAEQAAASAVAKARSEFDEAASQSGVAMEPPMPRSRQTRNGFHSQYAPLNTALSPAVTKSAAGSPGGRSRHPHGSSPDQVLSSHCGPVRTKGGPRTGRNHHRAGASPSNLNKSLGYIGSRYLGVNGVRHAPKFPLRWRAGTWDPYAKKTVYIGSYDTEVGAAAAVDAWHVSQGREPVNFPLQSPLSPAAPAAEMADAGSSPGQVSQGVDVQEAEVLRPSAKDHLYHAATLLNSLRPSGQPHQSHADPVHRPAGNGIRRPQFASHGGHAGGKSQRQSAAGALVAKAVGRSKASRDGRYKGRNPFPHLHSVASQSRCKGVSFIDGRWHAQIRVGGAMKYLGRFQHQQDAAEAYEEAARQKLLMQGA